MASDVGDEATAADRDLRALAAQLGNQPIHTVAKVQAEYKKCDSDGSGLIRYDEFKIFLAKVLKAKPDDIPVKQVTAFWREMDTNSNNYVDFEEFYPFCLRNFDIGEDGLTLKGT